MKASSSLMTAFVLAFLTVVIFSDELTAQKSSGNSPTSSPPPNKTLHS